MTRARAPSPAPRLKAKREQLKEGNAKLDKSEEDLKALQSVGQMIGEVLKQLDEDRFIVKASSGPRYVVGVRRKVRRRGAVCVRSSGAVCRSARFASPPLTRLASRSWTSPSSSLVSAWRWT